jgi:HlyD family secretion protein
MMNGRRIGAAAFLWAVVAGCGDETEAVEVGIQTVTVERGNLRKAAEATGGIEPVRKVEVKSKASGEITRLYVDVGTFVQAGALLAEVDPRDVQNAHDQAVADLSVSEAQAENARNQLSRQEELHRAGVITNQELESARLQATNTQASLTRARTNLELARLRLQDVTIRAPMAGTILTKAVEQGAVIQSASGSVSGGTALFVMADLQQMQVRVLIDETDIGQLRAGLPVNITVQAYPDRRFAGVLEQIQPQAQVQQNVTKFPAIISLDNIDGLLKPGMNADVEILIDEATDVLLLDNMAFVAMDDVLPAARALGLDESTIDVAALNSGGGRQGGGGAAGGQAGGGQAGGGGAAAAGRAEGVAPAGGAAGGERGATAPSGEAAPGEGRAAGGQAPAGEGAAREGQNAAGAPRGQGRAGGGAAGAGGQGVDRAAFQGRGGGGGRGGQGGGRRGGQGNPNRVTTRVVVFKMDDAGTLTPTAVTIGLNDWERAQVVSGLEEGDRVALVGAAQLAAQQQQQMLQGRGGLGGILGGQLPGQGRGGFGGPGGGGGRGGPGGGGGRGGE